MGNIFIESGNTFNIIYPHESLRKYILFYNIVFPACSMFVDRYTLMPDACGTLSLAFDGNTVFAELWGASMTPTLLGSEPNKYRILLLIQLSPFALYQLTRQNQAGFADLRLSLEDVDSDLFCSLCHVFLTTKTIADLVHACDAILYRRLERGIVSNALFSAVEDISNSHGQMPVKEAARRAGYSERQLNRLFLRQIGMNVKSYSRISRFNYALKYMQRSPCVFATVSQEAGYFDQPHFDKDFKAISGFTPQDYLKEMSDFYYDESGIITTLYPEENK